MTAGLWAPPREPRSLEPSLETMSKPYGKMLDYISVTTLDKIYYMLSFPITLLSISIRFQIFQSILIGYRHTVKLLTLTLSLPCLLGIPVLDLGPYS